MTDQRDNRSFLDEYVGVLNKSRVFFAERFRKNIPGILLIIFCFTAAGAGYWYSRTPYFESDLVCGYNNERFSRKTFGEMTQKLNLLAQSHSRNELALLLGLSPEQTGKIIAIDGRNRVGSFLHEDITGDYQPLYFTLKATDRTVFIPFQNALVNYLSSTPYQKDIGAVQIAKIVEKIGFVQKDIGQVDSIIAAYTGAIRSGLDFRDTVAGHSDIIDMLRYKDELEEKLTHLQQRKALESGASVIVMHGFNPADNPVRGSKKIILGCALIGVMVAMCWAVLRNNKPEHHA
jgi:hypothetical protein